MSSDSTVILVLSILVLAAVGFTFGALWCFMKTRIFLRRAVTTEGVVIGNAVTKNSDSADTYVPVISFVAAGGILTQFTGGIGSNPPVYRIGERVRDAYSPQRPHDARILTFFNLYWLPLMFSVFSCVFSLMAISIFFTGV